MTRLLVRGAVFGPHHKSPAGDRDPFHARRPTKLAQYARWAGESSGKAAASRPHVPAPVKSYHSDIDTPNYKLAENPNNFAMVVGIEKYASLPEAEFAERDAKAVTEHLIALGYPRRNIIHLTGSNAGKSGMEKYLEAWLPRNVSKDSRVFFYFSGHGAPDTVTGQAYLVPWDGDAKFLKNTGYPVKRLYRKLGALKAKEVVVALDACFSGAGGRSVLARGTRPLVTKVDVGMKKSSKLVVFSASAADEITGTDETQGHGLFTYYFLKGLNEKRGNATLQDLYDYLKPKVQDAARRDNRDQTPRLMPADLGARARQKLR